MIHNELFFGFPSGMELIHGRKTYSQKLTIQCPTEQLRLIAGAAYVPFTLSTGGLLTIAPNTGGGSGDLTITCLNFNLTGSNALNINSTATFSTGIVSSSANQNIFVPDNNGQAGTTANARLLTFGATTMQNPRLAINGSVSPVMTAGVSSASFIIGGVSIQEAISGTHAGVGQMIIKTLTITAGVADTNYTFGAYIESAPTGITPLLGSYAFWIDADNSRFDGAILKQTGAAAKFASCGGKIKEFFADVGNVTTGETDLHSYTTEASIFGVNGDTIEGEFGGVFVSSGTATRQVKLWFGGTAIFDTGALTLSLSSAWTLFATIIRVSSTVVRYMISFTTQGAALSAYTSVGELTGLTLSNTNVLKTTGQAAGVGAATNDIVEKLVTLYWFPVSV